MALVAGCLVLAPQSCGAEFVPAQPVELGSVQPVEFAIRGGWLAPRTIAALDSEAASRTLARMKELGVTHVAVGHDVQMPKMAVPNLEWGESDTDLVAALRRIRRAGLEVFLLPRIESPEFFVAPFPFRADIGFEDSAEWERFHAEVQAMNVHYARLAQAEGVAIYGVGLELKRSVRGHEARWREIIAAVRAEFGGAVTYSANWYDEWQEVPFWDALDYIGVGAYFELGPVEGVTRRGEDGRLLHPVVDVVSRWQPHAMALAALTVRVERPVLFTEIGYTGYADTVEKPWEWAGKQSAGVPIDHHRQAQAYAGLFAAFGAVDWMHGMFLWTFYTDTANVEDWEYTVQGRPSEAVVHRAFRGDSLAKPSLRNR